MIVAPGFSTSTVFPAPPLPPDPPIESDSAATPPILPETALPPLPPPPPMDWAITPGESEPEVFIATPPVEE